MPTSSTTTTCIARYRADSGLFSDAGTTPAVLGSSIAQWNDLTGNGHHLTQTNAANRPALAVDASRSSVNFSSSTFFNLPASLTSPGSGCAILICSRGTGTSIVVLGTSFSYGGNTAMVLTDTTSHPFAKQTYLPTLTPIVHGIRCQPTTTRLCVGTNQTSDLAYNISAFNSSGGTLGQNFIGEIYELAIFSPASNDSQLIELLSNLQDYNGITDKANSQQIIFIGDASLSNCPAIVCQSNGDAFKPLLLAQPAHTIAQQLALVNAQLTGLDLTPFDNTIAVVCCGSNDAVAGHTATQIQSDLSALCAAIRSLGIKVLLATIPNSTLSSLNATLRSTHALFADALVDWAADPRLADSTNPAGADDGVKAALLQPAIQALISPPDPAPALQFGAFYSGSQTFPGTFGRFVQA